jgi:hypothetical protein
MWSINKQASENAVKGWSKGMKWAYLEYLSTTTRMAFAEPERGRPSTKSKEMNAHEEGTSNGCNRSEYLAQSSLD